MTIVTGAVRLPHVGSLLETGTGESSSLQVPADATSALMSPLFKRWVSYPHMRPAPAMKQRMKPTIATPVFISAPPSRLDGGAPRSGAFFGSFDMEVFLV